MNYVIGPNPSADVLAKRERLGLKGHDWRHIRIPEHVRGRRFGPKDSFYLTWDSHKMADLPGILQTIRNNTADGSIRLIREEDVA